MRAAVSVVIPTLNAAAGLPGCLAALMEGVEAGVVGDSPYLENVIVRDHRNDTPTRQDSDDHLSPGATS